MPEAINTSELEAEFDLRFSDLNPILRRGFIWISGIALLVFLGLSGLTLYQQQQTKSLAIQNAQQMMDTNKQFLQSYLSKWMVVSGEDYPLQALYLLRESVFKAQFEHNGFLFVFDQQGRYLHHPNQELVFTKQVLNDHEPAHFLTALNQVRQDQQAVFQQSRDGGKEVWLLAEPIKGTPYYLGMVLFESELAAPPISRVVWTLLAASGSLFLLFSICWWLRLYQIAPRELMLFSSLFSGVALVNIIFLCYLQLNFGYTLKDTSNVLVTPTDLNGFKSVSQIRMADQNQPDTTFIPTGLFIQSLSLEKSDTVRISGYLWQKYFKSVPVPEIEQGFLFSDAQSTHFSLPYREDFGNYEIRGTHFDVTLHQELSHREYPLNVENIQIRLRAPNFSKQWVLSPELDAYNPSFPLGLDTRLNFEGWELMRSFFSYDFYKAPTNFGIGTQIGFPEYTELSLNILVRRKIWGAFLLHLVNIILVLGLLFIVFIKTTSEFRSIYKPLDIFGPTLGLLFPLFLAHYRLRSEVVLATEKLLYVDGLYFIAYGAITLVVLNFSLLSDTSPLIFRYKKSILQKSLFWPLILLMTYCITLFFF